jgi:hypothetical protein
LAELRHRPLPSPAEALDEPLRAFPSWFLRIECDRCGAMQTISEKHGAVTIGEIIGEVNHAGCGGRAARAELLTGIDGVSSQPVRRIVLRG